MAEEAGIELAAVVPEHLSKVKQALFSRSIIHKTLEEEAVHGVSEMDSLLNELRGMILSLVCMLEKALTTAVK
jgi:hypothetical protein